MDNALSFLGVKGIQLEILKHFGRTIHKSRHGSPANLESGRSLYININPQIGISNEIKVISNPEKSNFHAGVSSSGSRRHSKNLFFSIALLTNSDFTL